MDRIHPTFIHIQWRSEEGGGWGYFRVKNYSQSILKTNKMHVKTKVKKNKQQIIFFTIQLF